MITNIQEGSIHEVTGITEINFEVVLDTEEKPVVNALSTTQSDVFKEGDNVYLLESIDPNGQSLADKNWSYIKFPIIKNFPPPKRSGVIKFPILRTKTNINPANIPGKLNGIITLIRVSKKLPPKSSEASIISLFVVDKEA